MRISIITKDLSNNSLARAFIIAKALQKKHDVEIAGFLYDKNIWYPLSDDKSIDFKSVKLNKKSVSFNNLRNLYQKIDGDIIL